MGQPGRLAEAAGIGPPAERDLDRIHRMDRKGAGTGANCEWSGWRENRDYAFSGGRAAPKKIMAAMISLATLINMPTGSSRIEA